MIDIILAVKFVHVLVAAAMFGTWLAIMVFMGLANGSGNTSVVALTTQFVVKLEMRVMIAAVALQPISGFPLAYVIGLSPLDEFWIVVSVAVYAAVVVAWLIAFGLEIRMRNVARTAALESVPLPKTYRRALGAWRLLAVLILIGTIGLILLMVWQPRLD
jgi:uncharacterized membrane protein